MHIFFDANDLKMKILLCKNVKHLPSLSVLLNFFVIVKVDMEPRKPSDIAAAAF